MWHGNTSKLLREIDCPNKLTNILVATGLAESKTEAGKLLKSGSIEIRMWALRDWWIKVGLFDTIPTGEPFLIRKGKATFGVQTVMFSIEGQTLDFWREFIDKEEGWKPFYQKT